MKSTNKKTIKFILLDDKDHFIKLKDEYIYDYLLITTNKTKDDIFNELKSLIQ